MDHCFLGSIKSKTGEILGNVDLTLYFVVSIMWMEDVCEATATPPFLGQPRSMTGWARSDGHSLPHTRLRLLFVAPVGNDEEMVIRQKVYKNTKFHSSFASTSTTHEVDSTVIRPNSDGRFSLAYGIDSNYQHPPAHLQLRHSTPTNPTIDFRRSE